LGERRAALADRRRIAQATNLADVSQARAP
jgi:hypothetical protein